MSKTQEATLFKDIEPKKIDGRSKEARAAKKNALHVEVAPTPKLPAKRDEPTNKNKTSVMIADAPRSVFELCIMAARDPNIDDAKLARFLQMAKEQEDQEAAVLFDEAMLAVQQEVPPIPRGSYNKHTKSWWARLETVSAMVDPILRKHNFTLKYGMGEPRMEDHYHMFVDVTWTGKLASGKKMSHTRRWDADIGRDDVGPKGEGTKSKAQGSGSVINYGRRYLKLMVTDTLVLGHDKDGNPPDDDRITKKQAEELVALCAERGISKKQFIDVAKVDEVEDILAARFDAAKAWIMQKPVQQ